MTQPEEHLSAQTYVFGYKGQVILRQRKQWGEVEEIKLEREEALMLAEWLATYCLNQFGKGQGTGE